MAIRKVSDLERLYLKEQFDEGNDDQISNMLFEISWPDSVGSKSFISKHMTYQDMLENILVDNLLCSETFVDFYSPITFHNGISVFNGAWISGDFFVNVGIEDDLLYPFHTWMRNGKTTIQSIGDGSEGTGTTILSSQYSNILSAGYQTIICAQQNIFQSKNNIICSDLQLLASFTDDKTLLRSNDGDLTLEFKEISCNTDHFYVNGNANFSGRVDFTGNTYFTNVINGCALCAKWADLAEYYEADFDYPCGTLIQFGGEKEITIAKNKANAIITTSPGLILNGKFSNENNLCKAIALVGRTPVRTVGKIKKFDKLVISEIPGVAKCQSINELDKQIIGIALESNENTNEKLINASVQLSF